MRIRTLVACSSLILGACSSGGGADDPADVNVITDENGTLVQFGLEGSELRTDQIPGLDAESSEGFYTGTFFFERSVSRGGTQINAEFSRRDRRPDAIRSRLDTCDFSRGGREFFLGSVGSRVDVGDRLLLSSDEGSFATIDFNNFYSLFLPDVLDLPQSLMISIPDAPFSMSVDLPVPLSEPIRWIDPVSPAELSSTSLLRWAPGDPRQSYLKVNLDVEGEDGRFRKLSCTLVDDGEFDLSSDPAAAFLSDEPAFVRNLDVERIGVRFVGSGNAVFELFNAYRASIFQS